jgi:hypothetical protein
MWYRVWELTNKLRWRLWLAMPFERYAVFLTITLTSSAPKATTASFELHDNFAVIPVLIWVDLDEAPTPLN